MNTDLEADHFEPLMSQVRRPASNAKPPEEKTKKPLVKIQGTIRSAEEEALERTVKIGKFQT